jgi:hypothetical protein
MKSILYFGDSNTYGYNSLNGSRYGFYKDLDEHHKLRTVVATQVCQILLEK